MRSAFITAIGCSILLLGCDNPPEPAAPTPKPVETGHLIFKPTPPDARLYVDGRDITDQVDPSFPCSAGTHTLIARAEGYRTYQMRLDVAADEERVVPVVLAPTAGSQGTEGTRGTIGATLRTMSDAEAKSRGLGAHTGVIVWRIKKGSAAERAGLQQNDVVVSANGQTLHDVGELTAIIAKSGGLTIECSVVRGGGRLHFNVPVDELDK